MKYDWGPARAKIAFIIGGCAFLLPMFLFGVPFPKLSGLEKGLLACLMAASMGTSLFVGERRPLLGMLVSPLFFLAIISLVCWWLVSR